MQKPHLRSRAALELERDSRLTRIKSKKNEIGQLQSQVCGLRGALEAILAVCRDRQAFVAQGPRSFAKAEQIAQQALASTTGCGHKEGRIKAEESYEKYRDEALRWHRIAGEREQQLAGLNPDAVKELVEAAENVLDLKRPYGGYSALHQALKNLKGE